MSERGRRRTWRRLLVLVVAGALLLSACGPAGSVARLAGHPPLLGVLGSDPRYFSLEKKYHLEVITETVGWNEAEPKPGVFDAHYLRGINDQIRAARRLGLQVVLEPGIEFTPSWVFALKGGTRFVDQYGDVFTGAPGSGNDIANAVTDPYVRHAVAAYLSGLARRIDRRDLVAVRQGGGPDGELRYPDAAYNGHTDCWWAYDASSQAQSPVRGWTPGTGTDAQAETFLTTYNRRLMDYGVWMNDRMAADFETTNLVMLPGWGERPGDEKGVIASRLGTAPDEWNLGSDWTDLLRSLPQRRTSVAYVTWLDAPARPGETDPVDFVATLVKPLGMREGGENSGAEDDLNDLDLTMGRAERLRLVLVDWFDEPEVVASTFHGAPGVTFSQLGSE